MLYVDAGMGHYIPAKALGDALEELGVETSVKEVFSVIGAQSYAKTTKQTWRFSLQHPQLERAFNPLFDTSLAIEPVVRALELQHNKGFLSWIAQEKPDGIVCTQYMASRLIMHLVHENHLNIPVMAYAPDIFYAQKTSLSPHYTKYFISSPEGLDYVRQLGIQPENTLELVPFPLQTSFRKYSPPTKAHARRMTGLSQDKFTILLTLGGEGVGTMNIINYLYRSKLPVQVVILGNLDIPATMHVEKFRKRHPHFPLVTPGFVSNPQDYTCAADVIMGKAGTNTLMEALYMRRPCMITDLLSAAVPAAAYLKEKKVGWHAATEKKQLAIIKNLIEHKGTLRAIQKRIAALPLSFDTLEFARKVIHAVEAAQTQPLRTVGHRRPEPGAISHRTSHLNANSGKDSRSLRGPLFLD